MVLILYIKFKDSSTHRCWAYMMENFIGKKNGQIKGLISNMWLVLCYTAQLVISTIISNIYTKFNNPKPSSFWEIFDGRSPYTLHRSERWKNRKFEKEGKINISNLIFFYTINLTILQVYTNFEDPGSTRSWEICDRKFCSERKKNGQIHELISNMLLILCYTVQLVIPNVCTKYQNPKSSSFREISDGKKKLTDKQT